MPITHAKVSVIPDGANPNQVQASTDWNADHEGAIDAADVSLDPSAFFSDNVQGSLEAAETLYGSVVGVIAALTAADIDFTPNGSIAATDVQAAIQEVRDEAGGGGGGLAIYGDGHGGDVVFDGVAEVEGATLDAGDYFLTATLYANNITVEAGVIVNTRDWPIYARGTLTNEGILHNDDSFDGYPLAALIRNATGGAGGVDGEPGVDGVGFYDPATFGSGGNGGAVGAVAGGSGDPGVGASWLLQRSALGGGSLTSEVEIPYGLTTLAVRLRAPYAGGTGGGGGGSAEAGDMGGRAGYGAGVLLLACRHIVNDGTLRALGLPGEAGTGANAGGGGGGQGGNIILIYDTFTGDVPVEAVDCAGGAGGAGIGTGDPGDPGDDGHLITIANA